MKHKVWFYLFEMLLQLLTHQDPREQQVDWKLLQRFLIFQLLCNLTTIANQALFHSYSKANREISKINSNILMEQQLLHFNVLLSSGMLPIIFAL